MLNAEKRSQPEPGLRSASSRDWPEKRGPVGLVKTRAEALQPSPEQRSLLQRLGLSTPAQLLSHRLPRPPSGIAEERVRGEVVNFYLPLA